MADFSLPSGRVVRTQQPLWGAILKAYGIHADRGAEAFSYAKHEAVVPDLSREEIAALAPEDGRALLAEVNAIFDGRPEEKEIPFENNSSSDSPEGTSPTEMSPPA